MFTGFRAGDKRIQIPDRFFEEVVPSITNVAELKVTLHVFWLLSGKTGRPRVVSFGELAADDLLCRSLTATKSPRDAVDWLREGLELSVARGTLLQVVVQPESGTNEQAESWYMVSTPANKRWIEQITGGAIDPLTTELASPFLLASFADGQQNGNGADHYEEKVYPRLKVTARRRTIFDLYEQNIGLITPLLAEQLQEAESKYPALWIEEAFTEAVNYNKRSWSYVRRILERWAERGRDDGKTGQDSGRALDPGKYLSGKYAHLFNRK